MIWGMGQAESEHGECVCVCYVTKYSTDVQIKHLQTLCDVSLLSTFSLLKVQILFFLPIISVGNRIKD